jgi:hypothetical protein
VRARALAQPGPHLGGREPDAVDVVGGRFLLGDRPERAQRSGELALRLRKPAGEPLDPSRLEILVEGGRAVREVARGEL